MWTTLETNHVLRATNPTRLFSRGTFRTCTHSSSLVTLTLILLASTTLPTVTSTDPVLSPQTIEDEYGNFADNSSQITWADIVEHEYAAGSDYDDGQGAIFVQMKDGFVKTLQPKMLDADLIKKVAQDGDYAAAGKEAGLFLAGFGFCLVVGLFYLLIFPWFCCCFCCCRLCGKCGGKRLQKKPSQAKCICFTVFLDIFIVLVFMGGISMVTMNDRFTHAIDYMDTAITDNVDDMVRFLNNTAMEAEQVALGGFDFTLSVLERDLTNIDVTLGLPIRDYIGYDLGVYALLDSIVAMDNRVDATIVAMTYAEANLTQWRADQPSLDSELFAFRASMTAIVTISDCDVHCDDIQARLVNVRTLADPTVVPTFQPYIVDMTNVQNNNDLTGTVNEGRATFDSIPEQLSNDTEGQVIDMINELRNFSTSISDKIGAVSNMTSNTKQITKLKETLGGFFDLIKSYDGYRSVGFLGSVLLCFFITLFLLLGVLFGSCCFNKSEPTQRNCCSNCSGVLLMSGVGLAWIFSMLFMIITFLLFLLGYPMHKFLCEPLTDPKFTLFKELLDEPGSLLSKDGYFMGETLFGNGSIPLTLSGVLKSCKKNEAAYEAFMLHNLIDLDQITNWQDSMNITETLNGLTTDVTNIDIVSNDTADVLEEMADSLRALDYDVVLSALALNATVEDLVAYKQAILDAETNVRGAGFTGTADNLLTQALQLQAIIDGSYTTSVAAQTDTYEAVAETQAIADSIPEDIDAMLLDGSYVENSLATSGDDFVSEVVGDFADRIIGIVESYVDYVVDQFTTNMARCRPVWNLWDSLIVTGLCDMTIGTLNGVWFSLGWCNGVMFFATVMAVKLSKYFRRMKYDEEDEEGEEGDKEGEKDEELDERETGFNSARDNNQTFDEYAMEEKSPDFGPSVYPKQPRFSKGKHVSFPRSPPPAYGNLPRQPPGAAAAKRNLDF